MDNNSNAINWFEIPVLDMPRARHFYQVIFSAHLEEMNMDGIEMAMFPADPMSGKVGGALVKSADGKPSASDGVTIYLNGGDDLNNVLSKVEGEGGKVVLPKTPISPEYGNMAFFVDTEGNRIGLHSQN